jgi:hypothetical protein
VPGAGALLVDAPDEWPLLALRRVARTPRPAREQVTDDTARIWLSSGSWAELDRVAGSADLSIPPGTSDDAIVHPYLAPVAQVMARWLGREGFHGGGIVIDGGVWAVLGDKTGGKSTLLAWLAQCGIDVVSDDVLVIDDGSALAGPRSIDLRAEAAQRLEVGEPIGQVGARERWRLALAPVPAALPLRGWITLEWGDEISATPLRGAERLTALLPHRGVFMAPLDPAILVHLSALPHVRFVRRRNWDALAAGAERLLDAIAG